MTIGDSLAAVIARAKALSRTDEELEAEELHELRRAVGEQVVDLLRTLPRATWAHASRVDAMSLHPLLRWMATEWRGAPSVSIFGPTDTGKTTATLMALRRLCDAAVRRQRPRMLPDVLWTTEGRLQAASPFGPSEHPLVMHALRCDLLIVDEVGQYNARKLMMHISDERYYDERRRTVIISGFPPERLGQADAYGDALVRRWTNEAEGVVVIDLFEGGAT